MAGAQEAVALAVHADGALAIRVRTVCVCYGKKHKFMNKVLVKLRLSLEVVCSYMNPYVSQGQIYILCINKE